MWLNTKNDDKQLCKFWERKKKNVPATHCCKACMESICDECKALHELIAILQNHKIVQIVDNEDFDNENEVEELCPEHKGKTIDAFCHCVVVFALLNINKNENRTKECIR